jgi:hypothetical protein
LFAGTHEYVVERGVSPARLDREPVAQRDWRRALATKCRGQHDLSVAVDRLGRALGR